MKRKILLILFIPFLFNTQCGKLCLDNKIIYINQSYYNGNELKINGYYQKACSDSSNKIIVFYKNGVFLTPAMFLMSYCEEGYFYNYFNVLYYFNNNEFKKSRYNYGLFNIKKDTLFLEGFKNSLNGECYRSYLVTALILDDSTFIVIREEDSKDPKNRYTILSDTFHYVHVFKKPDSTNVFFP